MMHLLVSLALLGWSGVAVWLLVRTNRHGVNTLDPWQVPLLLFSAPLAFVLGGVGLTAP